MKKLALLIFVQGLLVLNSQLRANSPTDILSGYQKLDSVITYNSAGNVVRNVCDYKFDSNKRLLSCVEKVNGNVFFYKYGYDDCGNQTSYTIYNGNSAGGTVRFKEESEYDNTDCTLLMSYSCEGIPETESSTVKNEYISYQYNAGGKIIKSEKRKNSGSAVIQEIGYTYYSDGRIESISYKSLENTVLTLSSKIEYTHFLISENIDHFKTETIYKYESGLPVKCVKTTYDPFTSSSEDKIITTIEYFDEDGINCISKEVRIAKYITASGETSLQELEVQVYKEGDMVSPALVMKYDNEGNITSPSELATTTNLNEPALWIGAWTYDSTNGIDKYSVSTNDASPLPQWSMKVFYDGLPTDVLESKTVKAGFKVYPNPVEDHLYVVYNNDRGFVPIDYIVYNLTGKLQLRGVISSENAFADVKSLPSGSYIISFTAKNAKGTAVFIKK